MNVKDNEESYYTIKELAERLDLSVRKVRDLIWEEREIRPALMREETPSRPTLQLRILDTETHYEDATITGYLSDEVDNKGASKPWVYLNLSNAKLLDGEVPLNYYPGAVKKNSSGSLAQKAVRLRQPEPYYAILTDGIKKEKQRIFGPVEFENFDKKITPLTAKSSPTGKLITAYFSIDIDTDLIIPREEVLKYENSNNKKNDKLSPTSKASLLAAIGLLAAELAPRVGQTKGSEDTQINYSGLTNKLLEISDGPISTLSRESLRKYLSEGIDKLEELLPLDAIPSHITKRRDKMREDAELTESSIVRGLQKEKKATNKKK